jgi:UDP-N-acetylglucosamine--N-acetylmuramyl-(pentapeptide) pyrophosphoryl-undecaprenol N-acetylglucosamine transferase
VIKKNVEKHFLLAAGGTGGHIFPAQHLGKLLQSQGHHVSYITDKKGLVFFNAQDSVYLIDSGAVFNQSYLKKMKSLIKIPLGLLKAMQWIRKNHVTHVIGFGGYASFCPTLAAQLMGRFSLIHEQNSILGRANILLSLFASHTLIAFPATQRANHAKSIGTFLDSHFLQSKPKKMRNGFNLLILGGSQASALFSSWVPKALAQLPSSFLETMQLWHQAPQSHHQTLKETYQKLGVRAQVENFFKDLPALFPNIDLVVGRAGGTSLAEWSQAGMAVFVVPLPHAVDNHQVLNAQYFAQKGALAYLEEKNIDQFPERLLELIRDDHRRCAMAQAMKAHEILQADSSMLRLLQDL